MFPNERRRSMKPIIAITPRNYYPTSNPTWHINQDYCQAIMDAGGIPIMILTTNIEDIKQIMAEVDGLLISGGGDVDPKYYHQNKADVCGTTDEIQDIIDLTAFNDAMKQKMPVLGICRGIQIINVALGGTLMQDIHQVKPNIMAETHLSKEAKSPASHQIHMVKNSQLALVQMKKTINSYHHQAIDQLAPALTVTAYSDDGIIEAVENETIIAVQWHPEKADQDHGLFRNFIEKASNFHKQKIKIV